MIFGLYLYLNVVIILGAPCLEQWRSLWLVAQIACMCSHGTAWQPAALLKHVLVQNLSCSPLMLWNGEQSAEKISTALDV